MGARSRSQQQRVEPPGAAGGFFRKGVSGGERKRTSIAVELLIDPSVLLLVRGGYQWHIRWCAAGWRGHWSRLPLPECIEQAAGKLPKHCLLPLLAHPQDEPTSGLDSTTSMHVMLVLRHLAGERPLLWPAPSAAAGLPGMLLSSRPPTVL